MIWSSHGIKRQLLNGLIIEDNLGWAVVKQINIDSLSIFHVIKQ